MKQAGSFRVSDEQAALRQARELLSPYFGGEKMTIYVPKSTSAERAERNARILQSFQSGQPVKHISRAEGVTTSWVRVICSKASA